VCHLLSSRKSTRMRSMRRFLATAALKQARPRVVIAAEAEQPATSTALWARLREQNARAFREQHPSVQFLSVPCFWKSPAAARSVSATVRAPRVRAASDDDEESEFDENERIYDEDDPRTRAAAPDEDGTYPKDISKDPEIAALLEEEEPTAVKLKPSELVRELDKYIIGQKEAKRAVAIALRNRWRRHRVDPELRDEIMPKNILMIGPTGCGKTEIARRLAKLTDAPFIKVEATKFTEVGFHGRDVDQIIRDLVRVAMNMIRQKLRKKAQARIQTIVENKLVEAIAGKLTDVSRSDLLHHLRAGRLDQVSVEIEIPVKEEELGGPRSGIMVIARPLMGERTERRTMLVKDARPLLEEAEAEKLSSKADIKRRAIRAVEEGGIVFIDEIDKICSSAETGNRHADASAEGVQRDLLPLIEGTTVSTRQGNVNTDHILFIASGAFHSVKPSDLLAELQGRLPIRVELKPLTEGDLYRILTETENNLIKQQIALLKTEGFDLRFTDDAIREIAKVAYDVNRTVENIGARRLHTIIERIMEEISFEAADKPGGSFTVDAEHVRAKVGDLLQRSDLSRYIL